MRIHEHPISLTEWANFFCNLHERGVRLLHSSSEYDSFELLCDILSEISSRNGGVRFGHIVKLAEPNFDDEGFDPLRLVGKVDSYLSALGCDRLDTVQWMWRRDLDNDAKRIEGMERAAPRMAAAFRALKVDGKIVSVGCFPYSLKFACEVIGSDMFDSLVVYRNPLETDYDCLLDKCASAGKKVIALRPFAAGKAIQERAMAPVDLIEHALGHISVEGTVFTATKPEHLDQILLSGGEPSNRRSQLAGQSY